MKEIMLTKKKLIQGGSVKKTLFVVAIAAMLVLSVASSAFAVNHSGLQRIGAAQNVGAPVGGGGVNPTDNVAGAGTFTYMDWSTGLGTNNLSTSPHGAYTTTTSKCVVCHAVHNAAPGNAPVGAAGATADTLLRMKASDACAFCHVTAGQTVNGRPVYDGVVPVTSGGSSNTGHAVGSNCNECHTGVHGANADQSIPALNGFLLKTMTTTSPVASTWPRLSRLSMPAPLRRASLPVPQLASRRPSGPILPVQAPTTVRLRLVSSAPSATTVRTPPPKRIET